MRFPLVWRKDYDALENRLYLAKQLYNDATVRLSVKQANAARLVAMLENIIQGGNGTIHDLAQAQRLLTTALETYNYYDQTPARNSP